VTRPGELRSTPPAALQPPPLNFQADAASLPLAVGDRVVYASHGIGHVESKQPCQGDLAETLTLLCDSGLKVTLPLARAQNALRPLSGEPELEEVRRTLRIDVTPAVEPWTRRHRLLQDKLAEGSISGLAEIVRDGIHRERRRAKGSPAPIANQLYQKARKLLVAEIAAARNIEPEVADAWISGQIGDERGEAPNASGR
jgi:RNA polymerase-interacting CarD/CdnL/TRCF family regulator